ncbi:MAG TPA: glycosyltransferase family 39 protein [Candidatus Dormibacteraeota bacterium]|nr:glycosyltransferase family 39 protein [Candidatus Dormibacteraeota bacterium]
MAAVESSGVRQALLAAAIGVAVAAQFSIHADYGAVLPWLALGLAAVIAAAVAGRHTTAGAATAAVPAPVAGGQRLLLAGLAVLAGAAVTTLSTLDRQPVVALLLWFASAALGALAVRHWQATPATAIAVPWQAGELPALAALLVLAGLARVLWIDTLPRAIFGDEPRVGMYIFNAYHDGRIPNFFRMGWNTWPVIGLSLQGLLVPLRGLDIVALRLSSALLGTLGVLMTYLLARELSGPRLALLAALLFAICRTAIDFSRLGIAHAQIFFLEPLALFHLWRAINGGRAVHWWMAGVASAWCLFSYNAGQLVPPLVGGWLVLAVLARPTRLRSHWRGAALWVAGFALILFPYAFYVSDAFRFGPNWGQFTIMARSRQTMSQVLEAWRVVGAGRAWEILERQIWVTWLGFGVLPGSGYNLGYRGGGMLDDVSAALFVLGLAMALRRVRQARDAFVPYWWLATVVAGGIVTADPPATVRMVGLLPAIAILAALPLDWLIATAAGGWRRAAGLAAVAVVLVGAGAINWRTYFVDFAGVIGDPNSELARYLHTRPSDQHALLLGPEHHLALQQELFLIEFPGRIADEVDVAQALPLHQPVDAPLTLVLGPTQETQAEYIRSLYPGAVVREVRDPNGALFFRAVDLSPDEVRPRTGLALSASPGGAVAGASDPFAPLPAEIAAGAHLTWSGQIYWPSDRALGLELRAARPTTVQVGDAPPVTTDGRPDAVSGTITLPRGWQPIRIEDSAEEARALQLHITGEGQAQAVTRWQLRPESEREGLAATYTVGSETVPMLDPQINAYAIEQRQPSAHVRTPFSAVWRGALRVDHAGTYRFDAIGSGPFRALLDGQPLFAVDDVVPELPAQKAAERELEVGLHPLEVTFDSPKLAQTTRRIFQLFWTPPGGQRQLIPPTNLVPPAR